MTKFQKISFLFLCIVFTRWVYRASYRVRHGSPATEKIEVAKEPVQVELPQPITKKVLRNREELNYSLHSSYEIAGKVISSEVYQIFDTNPFYDVDVAVIWGKSETELDEILKHYVMFQGARWAFFQSKDQRPDEEFDFLRTHYANNHLVPAENNNLIATVLKSLEKDQRIRIKGYLVDVFSPDGKPLVRSSRVRTDSGDGACEVIWVEEIQLEDRVFR